VTPSSSGIDAYRTPKIFAIANRREASVQTRPPSIGGRWRAVGEKVRLIDLDPQGNA